MSEAAPQTEQIAAMMARLETFAGMLREIRDGVIASGRPMLSAAEACELVNVKSASALGRWCTAWKVKASGKGRYSRRALMAGLEREANSVIPRRWTPERKTKPVTKD